MEYLTVDLVVPIMPHVVVAHEDIAMRRAAIAHDACLDRDLARLRCGERELARANEQHGLWAHTRDGLGHRSVLSVPFLFAQVF